MSYATKPRNPESQLATFGLTSAEASAILSTALRTGGEFAELFFEEVASTRVTYEDGRVDKIVEGNDRGVGLRILHQGRTVYGYTTEISEASLQKLAETLALGVSEKASAKKRAIPAFALAQQPSSEILEYRASRPARDVGLAEKVAICRRIDAGARKELQAARQISATFLDSLRTLLIVNSDGVVSADSKTSLMLICFVVASEGKRTESSFAADGGYVGLEFLEQITPESIGAEAARKTRVLLTASPAPSGTMPVVISGMAGGTMIHEAVGHGLEADLACNGLSVFQGKLGQQVASPLITVIDDGTLPEKRGSFAFDDEGNASRRNVLIQDGVLQSYMVDRLSAMKFDLMATGNGRRESFRQKPIVRMTNTFIAAGKDDPDSIVRDTKMGLYVKAMSGGQVNTVTGDFVFGVTEGYLIRDGKLAEPVRGATLVGNGPRVLSIVDRVGNDIRFRPGTCGKEGQAAPTTSAQPTLRIPELIVGGEVPLETYWPRT